MAASSWSGGAARKSSSHCGANNARSGSLSPLSGQRSNSCSGSDYGRAFQLSQRHELAFVKLDAPSSMH
jgi:hypothetical protein